VTAVPRRRRAASHLLAGFVGALVLAGCGSSDTPPSGSRYVAMGDSYSSGAGIAPVTDAPCSRSSANYASLVAKQLHYTSFSDVTCGGATTRDVVHEQVRTGNGPQLDALGARTRLVTLTIGLNDENFAFGLLDACVSASRQPSATCRTVLAVPDATVRSGILKASANVARTIRLIRQRAPKARVLLVGYPRVLPDSGDCPDRYPMVPAMEPRLRESLREINGAWRRAAAAADAEYVDTWTMSEGHDLCSVDPWVNGASPVAGEAAPMHPFPAFHRAVAAAIVKLVKKQ
jgi:lysophospholipase L1-like esterase